MPEGLRRFLKRHLARHYHRILLRPPRCRLQWRGQERGEIRLLCDYRDTLVNERTRLIPRQGLWP